MRIVLVAAVADNGVIGNGPDIPWQVPGEQAEFKALTMGHTLLMGRTTFESIGRPLPGRTTIVLTRDSDWTFPGVLTASSVAGAISAAEDLPGDLMVAGGAQVYEAAMPYASDQVISRIPLTPVGDVFYPRLSKAEWEVTVREHRDGYERVFYRRIRGGPERYTCPVCSFEGLTCKPYQVWPPPEGVLLRPPYEDQLGAPSYEVCDSCGFEFGNDDNPGTAERCSFDSYREKWIAGGRRWFYGPSAPKHND